MRKTMVVAAREYAAAVKSKAFLVSLVVMPLLMFGGIFVQRQTAKMGDVKPKKVAIVDRSGANLFPAIELAAEKRNKEDLNDSETGRQVRPVITLDNVSPQGDIISEAADRQRLALSDRVRSGELFAFVEIGPDVLTPKINATTQTAKQSAEASLIAQLTMADEIIGESNGASYATNRPTNSDVRGFIQNSLTGVVYTRRFINAGISVEKIIPLMTAPKLITHGLTKLDRTGKIDNATRENELISTLLPVALLLLMFVVVMVGASPLTVNLVEEKQLRIAEVLLGSLRPFELMLGKLLGGVGVALTLACVYFVGVFYVARQWHVDQLVSPQVIILFVFFTILATMMYGAMFIAAGSAVTNVKEAQSMLMPVVVLIVMPTFFIESLLRDPGGPIPMIGSFFPTSAPMMTIARIAIPPGIPMWQMGLSVLVTLLTTVVVIWCAGRIFRVGILMQGQGAKFGEMLKWIVRG